MAGLEGTLSELTIESSYLKDTIKLSVYKPANYTPLKSYSLLVCQDGSDYFQLGRIPRQAEALIEEMEMRESIIVGVPYPDVQTRKTWYHPDSEHASDYRRFLACELLPFLEKELPTEPLSNGRTLAGDSLAATVSLQTALEYPSLFGQVIMHSPYVNETVKSAVQSYNKNDSLTIYHVIGTEETVVKTTDGSKEDFLTPNRELRALLEETHFSYTYHEFEGNHTWTHWQKDLPRALKTVLPYA
ncbi:alpha/beta hydrolase [Shouchella shacheensis]|uniref:alpha/beta hydrolase n=1 Tax=Shouchella shacheensis TaxID=1649580 RepID=UPI0007403E8F|nr:alpha/beta hydrolase-fold protein [Shouchella shacheensis]